MRSQLCERIIRQKQFVPLELDGPEVKLEKGMGMSWAHPSTWQLVNPVPIRLPEIYLVVA